MVGEGGDRWGLGFGLGSKVQATEGGERRGAEAEAEERDGDEGDGGGRPPLIEEAAEGGWIPVCARRGARSRREAHVAGRLGSRGGFFPTRGFCLRRFGGQAQTGPARPTQAPHHANKRADRFQVKQVYIMQFLQSNEQNYQALKQTGNKIAARANFDA